MLRHALAVVAIVTTVTVVPAAEAADPTAQAFVDTVALASTAVPSLVPEVRRNVEALDMGRCYRVLEKRMPDRALKAWAEVVVIAPVQAAFAPTLPTMQAIVKGLDAIPTSDPALKSGRAAWRATADSFAKLAPLDRPCAKLEAWKKRGWKASANPKLVSPATYAAMIAMTSREMDRKFMRGVKRLRQLGISEKDADLWSGETGFLPINEALEDVLEDAEGSLDEGDGETPFAARR